jgi:hypothetical protein
MYRYWYQEKSNVRHTIKVLYFLDGDLLQTPQKTPKVPLTSCSGIMKECVCGVHLLEVAVPPALLLHIYSLVQFH